MQHMEKRNERPNVGGVSIRSRNGAPSRKGCVINGQMTKASNKGVLHPPPPGAVFQARLLGNQDGANDERCVFGKLSVRCFPSRPFQAPAPFQLWRYRAMETSAQGGLV